VSIEKHKLGKAIRQIRELRGYSQEQLGEKAGLKGNTVALIERGQRGVSLDSLNDLAASLEVPAACLTMLASKGFKGDSTSIELVKNMQELILSTIVGQSKLQALEAAERSSQAKVEAIASSPKLKGIARRIATSKKSNAANAKKPTAKPKPKKGLQRS
jgi:transcriptional regulator with XRE-family HTH domain